MKKILVLCIATTMGLGVFAQSDTKMDKMDKTDKMKHEKTHDGVMMKDGKMMVMKNGETMEMAEEMKMNNGTMVMKDGSVKMKDGKTMMMKDGEMMDMKGKMHTMKMDKMKDDKMMDDKK